MTHTALTAISPLDGRYQEKINDLSLIFSEYALIKYRVMVEIRWLQQLTEAKLPGLSVFSKNANAYLNNIIERFSEKDATRIKEIEKTINHDVKAVEYFIKEKLAENQELAAVSEFIHFGCTSEDINNLAYALMLQDARQKSILPTLESLLSSLKNSAHEYAEVAMLSRTHGQTATPTTVGKEFANFAARLDRQLEQLHKVPILGKLNGATGNYNAMHAAYPQWDWPAISQQMIHTLGLHYNPYTTQIEPHDYMAEWFSILSRINTILIDLSRDVWGYISLGYFQQKVNSKEVGSSTMPHKINPIDFENAEGNLGLANALLQHMALKLPISRWQRDLTDSTVLRNIGVALAHCAIAYQALIKGLSKISVDTKTIANDLDNHWEVLAEAIQTVMRREGITEPYEKLKSFTRGQVITKQMLHQFIEQLPLDEQIKKQLYALTPANYIGYASDLAKNIK